MSITYSPLKTAALAVCVCLPSLAGAASSFTTLYSFTGGSAGSYPASGVIASGETLYGTTGGGNGTVFSFDTSSSTLTTLHSFTGAPDGAAPSSPPLLVGNTLYGATSSGGTNNLGAIYAIDTKSGKESILYSFTGGGDGQNPAVDLSYSQGVLYGASQGGTNNNGYLFSINTQSGAETTLHTFGGAEGSLPGTGLLLSSSGLFYGMTRRGGSGNVGTFYSYNPANNTTTALYSLTGTTNGYATGNLTEIASPYGDTIIGVTAAGARSLGEVVVQEEGESPGPFYTWTGEGKIGFPVGSLVYPTPGDFYVYGGTQGGTVPLRHGKVATYGGSVFSINLGNEAMKVLYDFPLQNPGGAVKGGMALIGSKLYGVTSQFGTANEGSIFAVKP
jgi:uncharacterized repeat protein (TIGR03803 family)